MKLLRIDIIREHFRKLCVCGRVPRGINLSCCCRCTYFSVFIFFHQDWRRRSFLFGRFRRPSCFRFVSDRYFLAFDFHEWLEASRFVELFTKLRVFARSLMQRSRNRQGVFYSFPKYLEKYSSLFLNDLVLVSKGEKVSAVFAIRVNVITDSKPYIDFYDESARDKVFRIEVFEGNEVHPIHFLRDDIRLDCLGDLPKSSQHILLLILAILPTFNDFLPIFRLVDSDEYVASV